MDLQSFIQSGLLESYVLGQCTAEERALVERMLGEHAEARAELAAIEKALEGYAAANAAAPPAWMKGRILDIIDNESATPKPPAPSPPTAPVSRPPNLKLFQLLTLAFALLSGFFFFQKCNLDSEKTALETRVEGLQKQIDSCQEAGLLKEKLLQVNRLLRDRDDTRIVPLSNGANGKFTAFAYHNTARCEVAIDLNSLPAPDQGKYFQLWSIVNGATVSMGMVDLQAAGGWLVVPCQTGASVLAISQESNPKGNPAPTEVLMTGNIPPASG
ncbi:MAG TPA: anti-sigma factor [Saprospiraceae bacterium]|nr:anti-sigma factor [Saprospiraceae bacterium]